MPLKGKPKPKPLARLASALLVLALAAPLRRAASASEAASDPRGLPLPPHLLALNDGTTMPRVGLGVALVGEKTYAAVSHAIGTAGYRLVDTAAEESYGNEAEVGSAVRDFYRKQGTSRGSSSSSNNIDSNHHHHDDDHVFLTTKLWDSDHGFYNTLRAFFESHAEINRYHVDGDDAGDGTTNAASGDDEEEDETEALPIDLYLIHSPFGGKLLETWDALLYLQKFHPDKVRSIGVSNFGIDHLEVLREAGRPMPAVNQIELHPLVYGQRRDLLDYCEEQGIVVQAYGSLMHGYDRFLADPPPVLSEMAGRYSDSDNDNAEKGGRAVGVTHVLLQWALQHGFAIIPKSGRTDRITDNVRYIDLGMQMQIEQGGGRGEGLWLSGEDMALLDGWGDHLPYRHRNLYKRDWNWNPIDEAPVHAGNATGYWPGYEGVDPEGLADRLDDDDDGYGDNDNDNDNDNDDDDDNDNDDDGYGYGYYGSESQRRRNAGKKFDEL